MVGQGASELSPPRKSLREATSEGPQEIMLALDDLIGQRTRKNMHYVRERIGTQILQVLYR